MFLRAFSLTTTWVFIVFHAGQADSGLGVNEVLSNVLYTQHLSPRWTDVEFSRASGLYATAPIILGAVGGGYLADRYGRRLILSVGYIGYGAACVIFAAFPGLWNEGWFAMSYLLSYETLAAIGSVGFLSMAMRISWTVAAGNGVHHLYDALQTFPTSSGTGLAGPNACSGCSLCREARPTTWFPTSGPWGWRVSSPSPRSSCCSW